MEIIDYIPVGHEKAIRRRALGRATGLSDRQLRKDIHYARRDNVILNMQDGDGYFQPDMDDPIDRAMLDEYVEQETHRLQSIGWSLKAARQLKRGNGE